MMVSLMTNHHFNPMQLPYFFESNIPPEGNLFLGEGTSKHISQVLRMHEGQFVQLTNGKGELFTASINTPNKKGTEVKILSKILVPAPPRKISIAISPLKNTSRFEWFLEKVTELGVAEIIPLLCERTEKSFAKMERLQKIIISAIIQSRQCWIPELKPPVEMGAFVKQPVCESKYIAHCISPNKTNPLQLRISASSAVALIGPEGDFTESEVQRATENGFQEISLGATRLRTETAGIVAAVLLLNR